MIKKFEQFLNESYFEKPSVNDPTGERVFGYTLYRIPTDKEMKPFENHPEYTPEDVLGEFIYIIEGKGIMDGKNKQMIIKCVENLVRLYPNEERYKEALKLAHEIKLFRFEN